MKKSLMNQLLLILFIPIILIICIQTNNISAIFKRQATERQVYIENIVKSVTNNINDKLENVKKTGTTFSYSKYVQAYLDPTTTKNEKDELRIYIQELINFSRKYNDEIVDIMLTNDYGVESLVGYSSSDIKNLVAHKTLTNRNLEKKTDKFDFLDVITQDYKTTYLIYTLPVFSLKQKSAPYNMVGTVSVVCTIKRMYKTFDTNNDVVFEIFDDVNNATYVSGTPSKSELVEFISKIERENLISRTQKIGDTNLSLKATFINTNNYSNRSQSVEQFVFWVLFILFFSIYIWIAITLIIIRPIRKINQQISIIGDVNLNQRISYTSANEIGSVAVHINNMLNKIYSLNKKIFKTQSNLYEAEIEKSKSQLYAFQSQVNPHFLFNTLQCIRSKALMADEDEIAEMCVNISQIFRYGINKEDIVTLEKELSIIEKYLNIVAIRFQGKITYEINVFDKSYLKYEIPKMILQPLVENSVFHGLEPLHSQGKITVNICANDTLDISVIDNGAGFSKEKLEAVNQQLIDNNFNDYFSKNKSDNIGLLNVHNRILLHFGRDYGLSIKSENSKTIVLMRLPK